MVFDEVTHEVDGGQVCVDFKEEVEGSEGGGEGGFVAEALELLEAILADLGKVVEVMLNRGYASLQGSGCGILGNDGRADEVGVLDLFDGVQELGRNHHIPDSPTGEAVGFGKGVEPNGVVVGSGNGVGGEVLCVFVSEVFVGFVSNVIDAVLFAEGVDGP